MASSLPRKDYSSVEEAPVIPAPHVSAPLYDYGFDKARIVLPYSHKTGTYQQLPRSKEKRMPAMFAAIVSVVAVIMLIFTCKAVINQVARPSTIKRRLSDDGEDSDPERLVIICEDSEESDVEVVSSASSSDTSSEEDQPEPHSKTAKLVTGATQGERTTRHSPPSDRKRKRPSARLQSGSPSAQEGQGMLQEAGQPLPAQPSTSAWFEAQQQTAGESTSGVAEQPAGRVSPQRVGTHTQHPASTVRGMVLTQLSPVIWSARSIQRTAEPSTSTTPFHLQPSSLQSQPSSAEAQGTPVEAPPSVVARTPSSAGAVPRASPTQHDRGHLASQPGAVGLLVQLLRQGTTAAPSSSAASSSSQSTGPQPSSSPAANWSFDPRRAMRGGGGGSKISKDHDELRRLLARSSLDAWEMRKVAYLAECVINYLRHYQRDDISQCYPGRAIDQLARRVLLLRLLLSALPVLGQSPSASWWSELTAGIPHVYGASGPDRQRKNEREVFNWELARRLSAALGVLKTGAFPEARDMSVLEDMLFHSPLSPGRFQNLRWYPLQQADRGADVRDDEDSGGDRDDT